RPFTTGLHDCGDDRAGGGLQGGAELVVLAQQGQDALAALGVADTRLVEERLQLGGVPLPARGDEDLALVHGIPPGWERVSLYPVRNPRADSANKSGNQSARIFL